MDNILLQLVLFIISLILITRYAKKLEKEKVKNKVNLSANKTNDFDFDYKRKQYLLTKSEHDFFNTLNQIIEGQLYIFPQVHLSHLFEHKVYGQDWRGALNHIQRKSVDFVICDKEYLKPLCAIELDDSSHNTKDRADRDETVEEIFKNANLPLIRIKNTGTWDKEKIKEQILKAIE